MKPSVKLRPEWGDLLVVAVIAALAAAMGVGLWFHTSGDSGALCAIVSVKGTEVDRVELSSLVKPEERTYAGGGYTLTVAFSASEVRVSSADCPHQDCVRTGAIHAAGQSIVCLPARIAIRLTAEDSTEPGVDAVIG